MASRLTSLLLVVAIAACGGASSGPGASATASSTSSPAAQGSPTGSITGATGSSGVAAGPGLAAISLVAGAPATPAPATTSSPLPTGGSGSGRWEMGAPQGLYVVDPAAGEPRVEGLVNVTFGPISTGSFSPPPDAAVTLNGVPMLRDPNLSGSYWRVDPAGPQPDVGSGGELVLVATATVSGTPLQRTLVLPCPSDVDVSVGVGAAGLHLASPADLAATTVNVPLMASVFPTAMIFGYEPATRTLSPGGAAINIAHGTLSLDVPLPATAAPDYLLDLRWPGTFILDGQTGGFCGLVKRWALAKPAGAPAQ